MEEDIIRRIEEQEKKLDDIYVSVEKTRKYFLWALIATGVTILLPLIGLAIAIPQFLKTYSSLSSF